MVAYLILIYASPLIPSNISDLKTSYKSYKLGKADLHACATSRSTFTQLTYFFPFISIQRRHANRIPVIVVWDLYFSFQFSRPYSGLDMKVKHSKKIPTNQECAFDKSHNRACYELEQNPDGSPNLNIKTPDFVKLNVCGLVQRHTIKGFSDCRGGTPHIQIRSSHLSPQRSLEKFMNLFLTVWKLIKQIQQVYSQGYLKTLT